MLFSLAVLSYVLGIELTGLMNPRQALYTLTIFPGLLSLLKLGNKVSLSCIGWHVVSASWVGGFQVFVTTVPRHVCCKPGVLELKYMEWVCNFDYGPVTVLQFISLPVNKEWVYCKSKWGDVLWKVTSTPNTTWWLASFILSPVWKIGAICVAWGI